MNLKIYLFGSFIFLFSGHSLQAHNDSLAPLKLYKTWIILKGEKQKMKGVIFDILDSAILVSNSLDINNYHRGRFKITRVDAGIIDKIIIRKNNFLDNAAPGAIVGIVIGGASGLVSYAISGDLKDRDNVKSYAALGMLAGGTLTGLIGSLFPSKTIISINGSQEQFENIKSLMNPYTIENNLQKPRCSKLFNPQR